MKYGIFLLFILLTINLSYNFFWKNQDLREPRQLVINKGIRQGEFLKVDTRVAAIYILSVFQGINWFCIFDDTKINAENYIRNSMELILNGLAIQKET